MSNHYSEQLVNVETTCGSLLCELKKIWDEVGEPEEERDAMLLDIEKQCLRIYIGKVEEAKKGRAKLQQQIDAADAEISDISASLGVKPVNVCGIERDRKPGGSLKEELRTIVPLLEEMRRQKVERKDQFVEVLVQLQRISDEIFGLREDNSFNVAAYETDLSLHRLEELHRKLSELQNEKTNRLNLVHDHLDNLWTLCLVLGIEFKDEVSKIHPTLEDANGIKDVRDSTIAQLAAAVESMRELKIERMLKLQDLAATMLELWNLMDTPQEEQQMFQNVTSKIAASVEEIIEPGMLSMTSLKNVEVEVSRLEKLKASKMKEIVLKKKVELEDICRKTHMVTEVLSSFDCSIKAMETGALDPMYLMEQIELQVSKLKEEALSRKEILEKVEKWFAACEEESWLEEYSRDDNRYNAGRGAHLALKRAEKARVAINKIPGMIEVLTSKTKAWEEEHGTEFLYDGASLISMLEQYISLREEKELEKQRQREQKRLQAQIVAEQEARFGSKPSPTKSSKKAPRTAAVANDRKFSLGGAMLQRSKQENPALPSHKKGANLNKKSTLSHQQSSSLSGLSARRCSELPGRLGKKNVSGAPKGFEVGFALSRKPLSPVSFPVSSNINIPNIQEQNINRSLGKDDSGCKTPATARSTPRRDEENTTPQKMTIPVPVTPSTISAPMLMAATPATPACFAAKNAEEYSFEEVRFDHLNTITQSS